MYEELYAPIPDVDAYLERIGIEDRSFDISRDTLSRLIRAHLLSVPFENLDVWATGETPSLATADIFEKVVNRRRGGYCFELNSLFCKLLCQLGFDAYMVSAYVVKDKDFLPTPSHCVVLCRLGEEKYLCDVGLGAGMPFYTLPLFEKTDDGFFIEREGEFFAVYTPAGRTTLFRDIEVQPVDLIPPNYHISQLPTSPFRINPALRLAFIDGSASVMGENFKLRRGDTFLEKKITSEEDLRRIIGEHFGIPLENVKYKQI